jgi:hypothetical protein
MPPDRRHLRFQALALTTALAGLIPTLFPLTVGEPSALAGAYFGWTAAVYLLAGVGAVVAAASYTAGDPPRPGWTCLALAYPLLVVSTLVTGPHVGGIETTRRVPVLLAALEVSYSALSVAGFLVLAHAWRDTGLDTTSRRSRLVARALAVLVASALAGPDLVARLPVALGGDAMAITDVVTDLLDGALLVVAVPVLRAALALGGGLVAWPWALLTLSVFAWLGYDAATLWGGAAGLSPHSARVVEEVLRSVAALSLCSAGVAQRWAMLDGRG